jgi:hypothetical protein
MLIMEKVVLEKKDVTLPATSVASLHEAGNDSWDFISVLSFFNWRYIKLKIY